MIPVNIELYYSLVEDIVSVLEKVRHISEPEFLTSEKLKSFASDSFSNSGKCTKPRALSPSILGAM